MIKSAQLSNEIWKLIDKQRVNRQFQSRSIILSPKKTIFLVLEIYEIMLSSIPNIKNPSH